MLDDAQVEEEEENWFWMDIMVVWVYVLCRDCYGGAVEPRVHWSCRAQAV